MTCPQRLDIPAHAARRIFTVRPQDRRGPLNRLCIGVVPSIDLCLQGCKPLESTLSLLDGGSSEFGQEAIQGVQVCVKLYTQGGKTRSILILKNGS